MAAAPTLKQMAARSLSGHHKVLTCLSLDLKLSGPTTPFSEARGMRTCLATLRRWGCVEKVQIGEGEHVSHLTETGRSLLILLDEQWGKHAVRIGYDNLKENT